jgi:hypothetical protein
MPTAKTPWNRRTPYIAEEKWHTLTLFDRLLIAAGTLVGSVALVSLYIVARDYA